MPIASSSSSTARLAFPVALSSRVPFRSCVYEYVPAYESPLISPLLVERVQTILCVYTTVLHSTRIILIQYILVYK